MRIESPRSKTTSSSRRDAVFYAVEAMEPRLLLSAIKAKATVVSDFIVSGEYFGISALTVDLNATFPNDSALSATLTSPLGTTIQLFSNLAGEQNFAQTVFDPSAPQRIDQVAVAHFAGTFQPMQSFSAFDGQNPNGQWKLAITNSSSSTGTLTGFSVTPLDKDPDTGGYVVRNGQTSLVSANGTDFASTNSSTTRQFTVINTQSGLVVEGSDTPVVDLAPDFPINIPLGSTGSSTLNVDSLVQNLSDVTVTVTINDQDDLSLTLIVESPQGTEVTLLSDLPAFQFSTTGLGFSGENGANQLQGTTFSDAATATIAVQAPQQIPLDGTYKPQSPLTALSGQNPNGIWTLIVENSGTPDSSIPPATVVNWSVSVEGTPQKAPASLSGSGAADFSFVNQPVFPLAVGESTTFDVAFNPASAGTDLAQIELTDIDNSGDSYGFPIQGTGVAQSKVSVAGTTYYGFFYYSTIETVTKTYIITNTGLAPLELSTPYIEAEPTGIEANTQSTPVFFSEPNAKSAFVLTSTPSLDTLLPGESTQFVVSFVAVSDPGSYFYDPLATVGASGVPGTFLPTLNCVFEGQEPRFLATLVVPSNDPENPAVTLQLSCDLGPATIGVPTALLPGDATNPSNQDPSLPFSVSENGAELSDQQTVHLGYVAGGGAPDGIALELADNGADTLSFLLTQSGSGFSVTESGGTITIGPGQTADFSITPSTTALQSIAGSVGLTVADTSSGVEEGFTLYVDGQVVPPPTNFVSSGAAIFRIGSNSTFDVMASGFPAATFAEIGALPTGVIFNNSTGELSGAPTGNPGTYRLTLDASNSVAPAALQSFSLLVEQAPAIAADGAPVFKTGSSGMFSIAVTGYPTCTVTETGTLPSGVNFNTTTGLLSGKPAANTGGTYPFTITAANGVSPNAISEFTLTVDQPPAITSASNSGNVFATGYTGSFTVTATGFPRPTFSEAGKLPGGVSFTAYGNATASLNGVPAAAGNYKLTLVAANGDASFKQFFTLVVNKPKAPVITSADHATFVDGRTSSFTVTTSGSPLATLSRVGALPSGVFFSSSGDTATIAGDPGQAGTFNVTILARNAVGSAPPQVFALTVDQSPGFAVGATSSTFTVGTNSTVNIGTVGYPTAKVSETGKSPTGVTFTAFANGTAELTGTPGPGTGGTYKLNLTSSNGVLPVLTESFLLTVDQPVAFASANHATFKHGKADTFLVKTTGFPLASVADDTPTSGLSFVSNSNGTGELTSTTALVEGTYALIFSAGGATRTFTLYVD